MINNMLGKINDVGLYYVVSMLIFITFFIGVTLLLISMKKSRATYLKNLPFSEDLENN